jgi:hypothetical protein
MNLTNKFFDTESKLNDFIAWIKHDASFKWYGLKVQKS